MTDILMPGHGVVVPPGRSGRIMSKLNYGQWYEWKMLAYISGLKLPGAYVDVGANIGNHTVFFAMNTPATRVYAVEPMAGALDMMREFLALNGIEDRVVVLPFAATDQPGPVKVQSVVGMPAETMEGRRLDDMVSERVAVMKIDIEGAEPCALRGATRILTEDKPRLFVEAHEEYEAAAIMDVISPLGYRKTGKVWNASPTYEFIAD